MLAIGGQRVRRALTLMMVAGLGLLAIGIVYLRPSPSGPATPSAPRARTPQVVQPVFFNVSFGDAQHGAVQVFSPNNPPDRPAPIYLTSDGGRTWRPVTRRAYPISGVTIVDQRRMLGEEAAGGTPALVTSEDDGRTWQPLSVDPRQFIGSSWPVFLGSDGWWLDWQPSPPGSQQRAAVAIWHTSDGGRTWARLKASGIPRVSYVDRVQVMDPRHGLLAVISAEDPGRAMIVATADGGDTWEPAATFDNPMVGTRLFAIRLFQHETLLLASLAVSSLDLQAPPPPGEPAMSTFTSVSADGGATWGPLHPGPVTAASPLAVIDEGGRLLLLDGHRLWISDDGGVTWEARVAVMPQGLTPVFVIAAVPGSVYAFAVHSSDVPWRGGTPAALLRSRDRGIHWAEVRFPRS
ncbi:MAG TPA: sialidase family protein [Candidatus Dormibacteraeota bacterium]|nr:sialidase family protein [Candidatus Dormibacteraeota bacterium]